MIIEQAYFGEKNNAHDLIASSFENRQLLNKLLPLTDKPAGMSKIRDYYSGYSFDEYYVFLKTFPDNTTHRSGMVFSHALIISQNNIEHLNNISEIFKKFITTPDKTTQNLPSLFIEDLILSSFERKAPQGVLNSLANMLIDSEKTVVWIGYNHFNEVIIDLWYNLMPTIRKNFRFRLSGSPNDIAGKEKEKDYTLVYTPEKNEHRWQKFKKVRFTDNTEPKGIAEKFLLNKNSDNYFKDFIFNLDIIIEKPFTLKKIAECYEILQKSKTDKKFINLAIRKIAYLTPSKKSAIKIKQKTIEQFLNMLENGDYKNILAIRDNPFSKFENGENQAKDSVIKWFKKKFNINSNQDLVGIIEIISDCYELEKNVSTWWKSVVINILKAHYKKVDHLLADFTWKIWKRKPELIRKMEHLLPSDSENKFFASFPVSSNRNLFENITQLSVKKRWYILHAVTLFHYLPIREAIINHLEFENSKNNSEGLKHIANLAGYKEFLNNAVKIDNKKLHYLCSKLCVKKPSLFSEIDLYNKNWQTIWYHSILKTNKIEYGISNISKYVFLLMDMIIDELYVNNELLKLIASSEYADIYEYPKREVLWEKLNNDIKPYFLKKTTLSVAFNINKTNIISLEKPLKTYLYKEEIKNLLFSSSKVTVFNKLKYLEKTEQLNETVLINIIHKDIDSITSHDSDYIGNIINTNNWKIAADVIYELKWKNEKLNIAYNLCKKQYNWFKNTKNLIKAQSIEKNKNNYPKIFISYNHNDNEVAKAIKKRLEVENFQVIIDYEKMKTNQLIENFIKECIKESGVTLSIVSTNSLISAWVAMETIYSFYDEAIRNRYFIPCYITKNFLNRKFVDNALDKIEKEINEIDKIIKERINKNIGTEDLEPEKTRYRDLKHKLPQIINRLKESFCLDLTNSNFENGIEKVINDLKNHFNSLENESFKKSVELLSEIKKQNS